jgi:osmotically-inducible protein OsmY
MRSKSLSSLLAFAFVLGLPFASCSRSDSVDNAGGKPESTTALDLRVKLELLQKLGTDAIHVDVEAEGGTVVLAGEVRKRATAELATEVAEKVEGVAKVENRIRVASGEPSGSEVDHALAEAESELSDASLETRVRIALVDRMGSDGFRIGTDAASGILTLELPKKMKRARRREAVDVAKSVEGVKRVVTLDKE